MCEKHSRRFTVVITLELDRNWIPDPSSWNWEAVLGVKPVSVTSEEVGDEPETYAP